MESEQQRAKRTKAMVWHRLTCEKCGKQCTRRGYGRDGLQTCTPRARWAERISRSRNRPSVRSARS